MFLELILWGHGLQSPLKEDCQGKEFFCIEDNDPHLGNLETIY